MSRNARRITAGHICKIAAKTIPRCGWTAIVMLCLGFCIIFPASKTLLQLQSEAMMPYEIIGRIADTHIDMATIMKMEGIVSISPIMQIDAQIQNKGETLNCEIDAVYSNYLELNMIDGDTYIDDTNMPYLLINIAALKELAGDDKKYTIVVGDTVTVEAENFKGNSIVCGIFDNKSDLPLVYMSYDTARKLFPYISSENLITTMLQNKGKIEAVSKLLRAQNVHVTVDNNAVLAWNLLVQQTEQLLFIGSILVALSTLIVQARRNAENIGCRQEINMLILEGIYPSAIRKMYVFRLLYTCVICMTTAVIISLMLGTFCKCGIFMNTVISAIFCIINARHCKKAKKY